jgi:hypothetical protein
MSTLDDQFSDYTPEVSDKEVESALTRSKPEAGVYLARSIAGARQISDPQKSGKGKVMFVEEMELLRPTDKAVSATTVKKWHILPIPPRSEWLLAAGYDEAVIPNILANFDADGKKKMWLNKWRSRLRAGFGRTAYPDYPRAVEGSNYTQFTLSDGTVVDEAGATMAKGELVRNVKLAAHAALKDTNLLKGQEFYVTVEYEKDEAGKEKDFPAVGWYYSLDRPPVNEKTGEPVPVLDPFVSVK